MTYALVALPWAIIVILLLALLQGQPEAFRAKQGEVYALATQNASLQTVVALRPNPTPVSCYQGTIRGLCTP